MVLDDPSVCPAQGKTESPWQHDKKKEDMQFIGKTTRKVDARSKVSGCSGSPTTCRCRACCT